MVGAVTVELTDQRIPFHLADIFGLAEGAAAAFLVLNYVFLHQDDLIAERLCRNLDVAGFLKIVGIAERMRDRPADGERAVIDQQHVVFVGEVAAEALALVEVGRRPLIFVVGEIIDDIERMLAHRDQAALDRGDGDACLGMEVDDRTHVLAR